MLVLDSGLTVTNTNFSLVLSPQQASRVIIAVPHDGLIRNDFNGIFQERKNGVRGRDAHVWPIANDIVQQAFRFGVAISAVRFLMPRAYVDANREMPQDINLDDDTLGQTAFDDQRLAGVYRHYHGALCHLVERAIQMHGPGNILFLDLHGFARQPKIAPAQGYDLILGTTHRTTIHYGAIDRRFALFMRERSYTVFLPEEKPSTPTGDPFSAGHTTRWYAKQYGINAMQIETFSNFRKKDDGTRGKKLATDIAEFFAVHYK